MLYSLLCARLRAQFTVEGSGHNTLHGSSSVEEANKEVQYFFPVEQTVAVIKPTALTEKGEWRGVGLCRGIAERQRPVGH